MSFDIRHRAPVARAGRLFITGEIDTQGFGLSFLDCAALPSEHQIGDIGAYAARVRGLGVRLRAIFDRARVRPEALYMNVRTSSAFSAALFTSEVKELGIVVYASDGHTLAVDEGGPFRLVLPGFHDERRVIDHVTQIDFALEPEPDWRVARLSRAEVRNGTAASYPREWIATDPSRPRSAIVPQPVVPPDDAARE